MKEQLETLCQWLQSHPAHYEATLVYNPYGYDEPVMKLRHKGEYYYQNIPMELFEFLYNNYVQQTSRRFGLCSEIVSNEVMQRWLTPAYRVLVMDDLIGEMR